MTTSQPHDQRRQFTIDDVYRMVQAGVLDEDEPLELINGELLIMPPQGPGHVALKDELRSRLEHAYQAGSSVEVYVRDQGPLAISPDTHPEPDLAVVRGRPRDYLTSHPDGHDVVVVIEIAWSSQVRDRAKAAVYATGGVAEYWLLDLVGRSLECYSQPDPAQSRYQVVTRFVEPHSVTLPGLVVTWALTSMLP